MARKKIVAPVEQIPVDSKQAVEVLKAKPKKKVVAPKDNNKKNVKKPTPVVIEDVIPDPLSIPTFTNVHFGEMELPALSEELSEAGIVELDKVLKLRHNETCDVLYERLDNIYMFILGTSSLILLGLMIAQGIIRRSKYKEEQI